MICEASGQKCPGLGSEPATHVATYGSGAAGQGEGKADDDVVDDDENDDGERGGGLEDYEGGVVGQGGGHGRREVEGPQIDVFVRPSELDKGADGGFPAGEI